LEKWLLLDDKKNLKKKDETGTPCNDRKRRNGSKGHWSQLKGTFTALQIEYQKE
jgi:hypothetical protein